MVGLWSENLVDNTDYLPTAGPLFSEGQIVSWFADQTMTNLSVIPEPGYSLSDVVSCRGWTPIGNGFPEYTEGQLLAMKYGPGGVEMFRPLLRGPVEIVPFGSSGHEVQFSATVTANDFTKHEVGAACALKGQLGTWFVTDTWTLSVKKDF